MEEWEDFKEEVDDYLDCSLLFFGMLVSKLSTLINLGFNPPFKLRLGFSINVNNMSSRIINFGY